VTHLGADRQRSIEFSEQSRQEIVGGLRSLGLSGARCVLVDVPTKANWGDSAIWQGELAACSELGVDLADEVELLLYDRARTRRAARDGVLLLNGGGNLGDLYPERQQFRETVLQEFQDLRIVQLPASIYFERQENLERARRAFGAHPDFTLIVRDRESLDFARRYFDCTVRLMPDMAFALGPLERAIAPALDVVWLQRLDAEAPIVGAHVAELPAGVIREDWSPAHLPKHLVRRRLAPVKIDVQLRKVQARNPRAGKAVAPIRRRLVPQIGPARCELATIFLSRGRAVITDRLHGHILCVLLGIPHVLLDNRIGKLSAYFDTWTHDAGIAQLARSEEEALDAALSLARDE